LPGLARQTAKWRILASVWLTAFRIQLEAFKMATGRRLAAMQPLMLEALRAAGSERARRVTLRLATMAIVTIGAAMTWNGVIERTWAAPAVTAEPRAEPSTMPAAAPPVIEKIQPAVVVNPEPQELLIAGRAFGAGLTAQLVVPLETAVLTFPAAALEHVSPTSFRLRAVLDQPGAYTLRVRSADGVRSNDVTFTVRAAPRGRSRR
jgi:hypothetical protein